MTAAAVARHEPEVGCVLRLDGGILVVWTGHGEERASYGARMLGRLARDRGEAPEPGEWVVLRRWPDGPVTVEGPAHRPTAADTLAPVVSLRSRRLG